MSINPPILPPSWGPAPNGRSAHSLLAPLYDYAEVTDDRLDDLESSSATYVTSEQVEGSILDSMVPVDLGTWNLNSVTTSGTYIQMSSSNATTARNYPPGVTTAFSSAGPLVVWGRGSLVFQMYVLGGESLWVRRRNVAGTWTSWTLVGAPTITDNGNGTATLDEAPGVGGAG